MPILVQDASSDRDEEFVINVNGLLEDPEYTMSWNTSAEGNSQPEASTSAQASSYVYSSSSGV